MKFPLHLLNFSCQLCFWMASKKQKFPASKFQEFLVHKLNLYLKHYILLSKMCLVMVVKNLSIFVYIPDIVAKMFASLFFSHAQFLQNISRSSFKPYEFPVCRKNSGGKSLGKKCVLRHCISFIHHQNIFMNLLYIIFVTELFKMVQNQNNY